MQPIESSRRTFLRNSLAAGTAGLALSNMTNTSAAAATRVIGANDRINVGLIGCGGRGQFILAQMLKPNPNTAVTAICDLWKQRREAYPAEAEKLFGSKPKAYKDYRELLADPNINAVIIATPDHQHAGQTIDAVKAGKHIYVEKPIIGLAEDLATLNQLYDTVNASKLAVQHGTHGVSGPAAKALKAFISEKKLGKLFRVEGTETAYTPYWIGYAGPAAEADTDWKAWLYNRKDRPFDAHMCARGWAIGKSPAAPSAAG